MSQAGVALLISSLSASFTAGGLIWQITLYGLSGSRLVIQLKPGLLNQFGTLARGPEKGWPSKSSHEIEDPGKLKVELAEISITNVGRTAISVSDISLDFGRISRWRMGRHTITGRPIAIHNGQTSATVRLEPGETASTFYDLWLLVDAARRRHSADRELTVRGSVKPAGKRAKRSPRRKAWKFNAHQHTLRSTDTLDRELLSYRAAWRALNCDNDKLQLIWHDVLSALKEGATHDSLRARIENILGQGHSSAALAIIRAYETS